MCNALCDPCPPRPAPPSHPPALQLHEDIRDALQHVGLEVCIAVGTTVTAAAAAEPPSESEAESEAPSRQAARSSGQQAAAAAPGAASAPAARAKTGEDGSGGKAGGSGAGAAGRAAPSLAEQQRALEELYLGLRVGGGGCTSTTPTEATVRAVAPDVQLCVWVMLGELAS